jgi:signal transduction histidine kinase
VASKMKLFEPAQVHSTQPMASHEQLIRAVQLATRKLASSGNPDVLLRDVLAISVQAVGASGGTIYLHDAANKRLKFQHVLPEDVADKMPVKDMAEDFGMAGEAFKTRKTQIRDFEPKPEKNAFEEATGVVVRTMIAVPLSMEDEPPIGVVQLLNKKDGNFDQTDAAVLDTIAAVSTMAILNWQLTEEATRASTLLGMGKVSHDIGNLSASLYSTISFSELASKGLVDYVKEHGGDDTLRTYVDMLEGFSEDMKHSVDRIVGYSRLISDLSAGRTLRPDKKMMSLADTIENAAAYLESEGRKNHVELIYDIQRKAPKLCHDDLYVFRIVQNLVGNGIKAVREAIPDEWQAKLDDENAIFGVVTVRYRHVKKKHIVEVEDTGPGMTEDVRRQILSGKARSQWDKGSGSGWGTKIVLELAATHNAEVSIDSEPGKGSIFRVAFPDQGGS